MNRAKEYLLDELAQRYADAVVRRFLKDQEEDSTPEKPAPDAATDEFEPDEFEHAVPY